MSVCLSYCLCVCLFVHICLYLYPPICTLVYRQIILSFQDISPSFLPPVFRSQKYAKRLSLPNPQQNKYIELTNWQREPRIDVRVWGGPFESAYPYPTKKGVSFPLLRWKALCFFIEDIDDAMIQEKNWKSHLGGNVYASTSTEFPKRVDIRQWFIPDGYSELVPTKRGINLNNREWNQLKEAAQDLQENVSELKELIPCFKQESHNSQLVMLQCKECSPNDWQKW